METKSWELQIETDPYYGDSWDSFGDYSVKLDCLRDIKTLEVGRKYKVIERIDDRSPVVIFRGVR